ncbi:MAG: T9SS type A sorting domain-containing protein [Ignavibacteriae bacterium]|nr:T9SS type A sorting domain-containing protein [Ignavibacteriota bacterium]
MKRRRLFFSLASLVIFVLTLSYAGKEIGVQPSSGIGNGQKKRLTKTTLPQKLTDSDVSEFHLNKARSSARTVNADVMKYAHVTPQKDVSATTPLAGTYQIPGDFPNISAAIAVLNYVGVSDDVTFELTASSYIEFAGIVIGSYAGNDDFTVTIQPAPSTAVTINFYSSATNGKGFAFSHAKNFTIDGLNSGGASLMVQWDATQPFPLSDGFGATVYITNACENIAVKNAHIKGHVNNVVWANQTEGRSGVFVFTSDSDPYESYGLTFDGCTITGATYGMKFLNGEMNLSAGDVTISHCRIGGAFGDPVVIGILATFTYYVDFHDNVIDGTTFLQWYWNNTYSEYDDEYVFSWGTPFLHGYGQATGMHWLLVDAGTFSNNIIRNVGTDANAGEGILTYGTRIYSFNLGLNIGAKVFNNLMYGLSNPGGSGSQITGIRGPAGYVNHNSVRLTGVSDASMYSTCIYGATSAYNNAFSNEMTGGDSSKTRGITRTGTFDNNAIYSTGYYVEGYATVAGVLNAGINPNGLFGPINFNSDLTVSTGPSTAEDIGKPGLVTDDFGGTPRDSTPDAGAYEFISTMPLMPIDIGPVSLQTGYAGTLIPLGVTVTPKSLIKNFSNQAVGSFTVSLTCTDGYSNVKTVSGIPAHSSVTVTFDNWISSTQGSVTLNVTTNLSDIDNSNNTTFKTFTVIPGDPLTADRVFTWDASDEGWTRTGDWVRNNTFTKLDGPYSGSSMVTERPNRISTYTEGAYASTQGYSTNYPGANILTSPWLNLTNIGAGTDLYISFFHSMRTEWNWDRSFVQYTTDGITWKHVGVLNDPNGLNWYDESLYHYARYTQMCDFPPCYVGPDSFFIGDPDDWPSWTSNEDELTPEGWVFCQLKMTDANYPGVTRSSHVQFRYVAFSDAVYAPDPGGWAIDNFAISANPCACQGGSISGELFQDFDGNGLHDGTDTTMEGVTVNLYRYGEQIAQITTDNNGMYLFGIEVVNIPGTYEIEVVLPDYGFTTPEDAATTGKFTLNNNADFDDDVVNFGAFFGSVSGKKFNDVNGNGIDDSEPGYSGWTIQVHKDSCNGEVIGSATTDANGNYLIGLPPGTYYISEVLQDGYKATTSTCEMITISVGSPTAIVNFGNFKFGIIKYEALNYFDCDICTDYSLPAGVFVNFEVYKNGVRIDSSTIGSGTASKSYWDLDVGQYVFKQINVPNGWIVSNGLEPDTVSIATSGQNVTITQLLFKKPKVNGYVFEDIDGDGVKDVGEPPLQGWTINISGNGGGTFISDSNGFYETYVEGGSHTISEVLQSGWSFTLPADSGIYTFEAVSGTVPGADKTNKNFGNFKKYNVSGTVFRDYNGNGVQDASDEAMSGVELTLSDSGSTPQFSSGDGSFAFSSIGPANHTLTVIPPAGFVVRSPMSGNHAVTSTSGMDVSGKNFALFQISDSTNTYRTFTADSLRAWATLKAVARTKTNQQMPNIQNMYNELYIQAKAAGSATGIIVGEANVPLSVGSPKTKGYILPFKGSDINATLYDKKVPNVHTGIPRGLDFFKGNEKRITKLNKILPPSKHDNELVANMLALAINVAASEWNKTPQGFADLLFDDGEDDSWCGLTTAAIVEQGGRIMTNWEGHTSAEFNRLNEVCRKINEECSGALDTIRFLDSLKLKWAGVRSIHTSSILRANPSPQPRVKHPWVDNLTPEQFALSQNYPNPFNPSTTFRFELVQPSVVTLKIYNMLGQEVATVIDAEDYSDGVWDVQFDASSLTSGVYFYRLTSLVVDEETGVLSTINQTKKMLLTK